MSSPQVRLDDLFVVPYLVAGPFGENAALVHDDDVFAVVHDNVHIVFDEEERVAVLAQLVDPIEELLL